MKIIFEGEVQMKVYLFFIYADYEKLTEFPIAKRYITNSSSLKEIGDKVRIFYAFTKDKSIRNEFVNTRNMRIFGNKYTTVFMDDSEYESFSKEHEGKELTRMRYDDHKLVKNGIGSLILTYDELSYTQYDYLEKDFFIDFIDDLPPLDLFQSEYRESFEKILYPIQSMIDYLEFNTDQLLFDELNLFLKLFGNTFKRKE